MDIPSLFLLMLSLMVMAAMPSTSVALVVVRSARYGVSHGLLVAAGIVLADLLFGVCSRNPLRPICLHSE